VVRLTLQEGVMSDTGTQKNGENESGGDSQEEKAKFSGEFDAERASRLIENLRSEVSSLKEERNTLKGEKDKREDAEKTELDRLKDRIASAENETKEARRALHVSKAQAKHGLSDEEAEEFLSGLDDEEQILARAERLAGLRGPGSQEENGGENDEGDEGDGQGDLPSKPKPNLRPGSGGSEDSGEFDEDAIVNAARERRGY
jgi:FtsZ-binding cell division protein ZapB